MSYANYAKTPCGTRCTAFLRSIRKRRSLQLQDTEVLSLWRDSDLPFLHILIKAQYVPQSHLPGAFGVSLRNRCHDIAQIIEVFL